MTVNCGFKFLHPQLLAGLIIIWHKVLILKSNVLWTGCVSSSEALRPPVPVTLSLPTESLSTETTELSRAETTKQHVGCWENHWINHIERKVVSKWESSKLSPSFLLVFSHFFLSKLLSPLIHSITLTSVSLSFLPSFICSWHYYTDWCDQVVQKEFSISI